jgi:hypothetical protein
MPIRRCVSAHINRPRRPARRAASGLLAISSVTALLALAACGSSGGASSTTQSPKTFGVNATGTVHFWARQATDGPAKALVKEFNSTHKNLKVVLHLTPPNDDTSQLATAIRAGSPPDVVGLNDIDVPTFSHENALLNIPVLLDRVPRRAELPDQRQPVHPAGRAEQCRDGHLRLGQLRPAAGRRGHRDGPVHRRLRLPPALLRPRPAIGSPQGLTAMRLWPGVNHIERAALP